MTENRWTSSATVRIILFVMVATGVFGVSAGIGHLTHRHHQPVTQHDMGTGMKMDGER